MSDTSHKSDSAGMSKDVPVKYISPYINDNEIIPNDIIGSQITRIGKPMNSKGFMSNGFVIEYKTTDGTIKQLTLGHDEYCLWIAEPTS